MNSTISTFDFAQKVALIEGGTGGLGSALAICARQIQQLQ
ncbi:MAG: hypothetical protein RLZ17_1071 [Actinomycetota bacterium]